jgi:hypothetical protein
VDGRFTKPGGESAAAWLLPLLEHKLGAVGLANTMARIIVQAGHVTAFEPGQCPASDLPPMSRNFCLD